MDETTIKRVYADLEHAARDAGLEISTQDLEIHMGGRSHIISLLARAGVPVRYPHWSFGGKGEKQWQKVRRGTGLGYSSMFLPTSPPRLFVLESMPPARLYAALARSLAYQDFCSRNEHIISTNYNKVWRDVREHERFVSNLVASPLIDNELLQRTIDAGHAVVRQTGHAIWGRGRGDAIRTMAHSLQLAQWQGELLGIIRREWIDLLPLYETWGMRMGYGAFWEQKLLERVSLPRGTIMHCLSDFAERIAIPHMGAVNTTRVFFKTFERLIHERTGTTVNGIVAILHDPSFIAEHLTQDVAVDSGLIAWGHSEEDKKSVVVTELSIDEGWEKSRDILVRESGSNKFPAVYVTDQYTYQMGTSSNTETVEGFVLVHDFDGRFLNSTQRTKTGNLLTRLLGQNVHIMTMRMLSDDLIVDKNSYAPPA